MLSPLDGGKAGKTWQSVINIGVRPTFDKSSIGQHVEAHILDFQEDLYTKTLRLDFIQRIRDEKKFTGIEPLVEQINNDIVETKNILRRKS